MCIQYIFRYFHICGISMIYQLVIKALFKCWNLLVEYGNVIQCFQVCNYWLAQFIYRNQFFIYLSYQFSNPQNYVIAICYSNLLKQKRISAAEDSAENTREICETCLLEVRMIGLGWVLCFIYSGYWVDYMIMNGIDTGNCV